MRHGQRPTVAAHLAGPGEMWAVQGLCQDARCDSVPAQALLCALWIPLWHSPCINASFMPTPAIAPRRHPGAKSWGFGEAQWCSENVWAFLGYTSNLLI
jgi:hypothetical protein